MAPRRPALLPLLLAILVAVGAVSGLAVGPRPSARNPKPTASRRALNRDWYARRASGDPSATRRKAGTRAKRSERAADLLYETVSIDPSITFPGLTASQLDQAAESMLASCHATGEAGEGAQPDALARAAPLTASEGQRGAPASQAAPVSGSEGQGGAPTSQESARPGVMWGSCSTGPVLCSRLVSAGLTSPTPIQESAFDMIAKGSNALLLAQTGSGKTLAFVLPLLSRLRRDQPYSVLFITPSLELASQLQTSVDLLWPPAPREPGGAPVSALRVIRPPDSGRGDTGRAPSANGADATNNAAVASEGVDAQMLGQLDGSPLLVGTPHTLQLLFDAAARISGVQLPQTRGRGRGSPSGPRASRGRGRGGMSGRRRQDGRVASPRDVLPISVESQQVAEARMLSDSLQAVVLDEADQLLGSDALAAAQAARRARGNQPLTSKERAAEKRATAPSACELLLRRLPRAAAELQFIAASASASRTLRRQLLPIAGGTSIDKVMPLIQAAPGMAAFAADAPKVSQATLNTSAPLAGRMPVTISHAYALWRPPPRPSSGVQDSSEQRGAGGANRDDEFPWSSSIDAEVGHGTAESTELREDLTAFGRGTQESDQSVSRPDSDPDRDLRATAALREMLTAISPLAPAPAILFADRGFGVAKTAAALRSLGLRNVVTLPSGPEEEVGIDSSPTSPAPYPDGHGATKGRAMGPGSAEAAWDTVPVFIASERYGRGLDLGLGYVLLPAPPATAAGYLHVAGRTGRQGAPGMVVTLLSRQQAPRLVAFSRLLGFKLQHLSSDKFVQDGHDSETC